MSAQPLRGDEPLARAGVLTTPTPSESVVVDVDAGGAVESSPASPAEVRELCRALTGWHGGSLRVIYGVASQLPRSAFLETLASVRDSESARSQVAVLIQALRDAVADHYARADSAMAIKASQRFGYDEPSATNRLRSDPERWVRTLAGQLQAADVDAFLTSSVDDELERLRLRRLAEELRTK